ncbi:hypothetical protein [Spirosoma flavus]
MLSISIASANSLIFRFVAQIRRAVLIGSSRQVRIQLTVLLVSLLYTCAVLEFDMGDTGDRFGDVYDTYVHSVPVQSPKPTESVYRKIRSAQQAIVPYKRPIALSVGMSFVLTLPSVALFSYNLSKRRRLQVMLAVWRL